MSIKKEWLEPRILRKGLWYYRNKSSIDLVFRDDKVDETLIIRVPMKRILKDFGCQTARKTHRVKGA